MTCQGQVVFRRDRIPECWTSASLGTNRPAISAHMHTPCLRCHPNVLCTCPTRRHMVDMSPALVLLADQVRPAVRVAPRDFTNDRIAICLALYWAKVMVPEYSHLILPPPWGSADLTVSAMMWLSSRKRAQESARAVSVYPRYSQYTYAATRDISSSPPSGRLRPRL